MPHQTLPKTASLRRGSIHLYPLAQKCDYMGDCRSWAGNYCKHNVLLSHLTPSSCGQRFGCGRNLPSVSLTVPHTGRALWSVGQRAERWSCSR